MQEEKAELLECEYCDEHFYRLCLKLSAAEYKLLGKRKDFHWYCPPCEEKALRNIKIEKEIEERCRDYFDRYEKCLSALEETITEKPDKETVSKMIEDSKSDINLNEMNEKLDEYRESVMRRSNIIIFKVDESLKEKPKERKEEDMQIINSLCTLTDASHESVKNSSRLGRN